MAWTGCAGPACLSMVDGYRHGFVKEVVSALLVLISVALVWLINPYVNQFIRENTSVYEKIQTASGSFVDSLADGKETMDEEEQKALISSMDIPDLLQKGITENNTALVYQYLAVNTFAGYISGYLANVAVNCLSFLVSYILSSILIHVLAYAHGSPGKIAGHPWDQQNSRRRSRRHEVYCFCMGRNAGTYDFMQHGNRAKGSGTDPG